MKNKLSKIVTVLLLTIVILSNVSPIFAFCFNENQVIELEKDHECISLLKMKGKDMLKGVTYVVYNDPKTGRKQPAFCVEPSKQGVGTGAGDRYDVTLNLMHDQRLWRALYKGYMGTKYNEWDLECDDDLYYATKTAVHSLSEGSIPIEKYEVPHRVGRGDNISLEDVQRRGAKVLKVAQEIYEYAINGTENYAEAEVTARKIGEEKQQIINEIEYLVQDFSVSGNRGLDTYKVTIANFPEGTKIYNNSNVETNSMSNSTFKIAIPIKNIKNDVAGVVNITEAKVKTYPVFYANAYDEKYQDYITYADPVEDAETSLLLKINAHKSKIKIIKEDKETHKPLQGVEFNVKYADNNENIGNFITDEKGEIIIQNLRPADIILTEVKTQENYILNTNQYDVELSFNSMKEITISNERKRGNLKIIKVDKDDNNVAIGNVEFELYSEEQKKVIGKYTTDENGKIEIDNLRVGKYKLIEKKTNKFYNLGEDAEIVIKWNEITEQVVENELKKGKVKIVKVDAANENIKLKDVEFEVLDNNDNVLETIKTNNEGEALTKEYSIRDYSNIRIREIKTNEYYELNREPINIKLEANKVETIIVKNKKKQGQIRVVKIDKDNNEIRIPNVVFYVMDLDGNIVEQLTTNENGEAISKELDIDKEYVVQEVKTLENYKLEETPQKILLKENQISDIVFENEKKKGKIQIIKVDKDDNTIRIPNVVFQIKDEKNNIVDTIKTDKNGEAISKKLPIDQKYTILEISTGKEYVLNAETITVTLTEDEITDVNFENEKIKGNVEITKIDKKTNERLKGATFGIYDEDNNEVDRIVTDNQGKGISKLLPYGKYFVKEIDTGSKYYLLNTEKYEFEISKNKQIISLTIENEPVDITVEVEKKGTIEIRPGEKVNYTFSNIMNKSNVQLDDFQWIDYIPTEYIRLQKMSTGTWTQDIKYNVYYKTNKSDEYILYEKDLSSKKNYELDFSLIELSEDEYIVETMFDFGKVDLGFKEEDFPTMECKSLETLNEGNTFTNKTKTIGVFGVVKAESSSKWTTVVHVPNKPDKVLPRTGK